MEFLNRVRQLLCQRLELNPQYLTSSILERSVNKRMTELVIEDGKQYYNLLVTNSKEFKNLIELVVVPETWFFRDDASFKYLVEWLKTFKLQENNRMIRILSLPCSTGEEPYSIAIALDEAGLLSPKYLIEGIDISSDLIDKSIKGLYSKNAFRTLKEKYLKKYFKKKGEKYILDVDIRSQVFFRQGNVFDENLFPPHVTYEAIFCRNLLIYLQPEGQSKLLSIMKKLLAKEGRLFVAPSELEVARMHGFQAMGNPQSCALRFGASELPITKPIEPTLIKPYLLAEALESLQHEVLTKRPVKSRIQEARELADQGCFAEARKICLEFIAVQKDNFEAFFLLGLICHASGDYKEAEEYFNKTLYLAPNHHEALVYMSLLMEKKGDKIRADIFRDRVQRCSKIEQTQSR